MLVARTCPLALVVFLSLPAVAHEKHASPSPSPIATPGDAVAAAEPAVGDDDARPDAPPLVIETAAALRQHMHNKIVHFPVALGTVGALLLLLSYRWPQFGPGARLLLVLAALGAWMAVRSGQAQGGDLEGGELGLWLERHEDMGEWTAWALTLTAIASLVTQARPFQWLLALVAAGLLGYTAFLGGILAHTPV